MTERPQNCSTDGSGDQCQVGDPALQFWLWALPIIALLACLAGAQAWAARYAMNPDGLCYVEIADAYRNGRWAEALNPYWSPLCSWLIALACRIADPTPDALWPFLHLLNWLIFVFSAVCAAVLVREYLRSLPMDEQEGPATPRSRRLRLWIGGGGAVVYGYVALQWIGTADVGADLLLLGLMALSATALLRLQRRPAQWGGYAMLGLTLGFGYLTKSVMLPLGLLAVALAACTAVPRVGWRRTVSRLTLVCGVWAVLCGPFIALISFQEGRLVLSDAGRLNYQWFVNDYEHHVQPDDRSLELSIRVFPPSAVGSLPWHRSPSTYALPRTSGLIPRQQIRAVIRNLRKTDVAAAMAIVAALLLCLQWTGWKERSRGFPLCTPPVMLCALAAGVLGVYVLVLIEPRYVAAGYLLAFLGLAGLPAAFGLRPAPFCSRWRVVAGVLLTGIFAGAVLEVCADLYHDVRRPADTYLRHAIVAAELRRAGIHPGDRVATLGRPFMLYSALTGRFQVGATVTPLAGYYYATPEKRAAVRRDLSAAGFDVLITRWKALAECEPGWTAAGPGEEAWYRRLDSGERPQNADGAQ